MPEKETLRRAAEDKREGKAPSTQAGEFVREEIDHIREGKHGARSAKQATTDGARTLLDLAEAHDLDIGYGCRAGSCGDCKVRVISGRVEMDSEDGLRPDEKAGGYVLTCVGRPATDCVVDA